MEKAGLIPYIIKNGIIEMAFMISSDPFYGGPDPMISKGCLDPGETIFDCAFREAEEELGLVIRNVKSDIRLLYQESTVGTDDTYIFCVYACEVRNKIDFVKPHFETKEVVWLTVDEFETVGRRSHQPIVRRIFETVTNM